MLATKVKIGDIEYTVEEAREIYSNLQLLFGVKQTVRKQVGEMHYIVIHEPAQVWPEFPSIPPVTC